MLLPDRRLFEADLRGADYRIGEAQGRWGLTEPAQIPEDADWPKVFFWLAAAPRRGAPERFHIALDVAGYRDAAPTGTFWDPEKKATLAFAHFPKGIPNSRFAKVFRTDWSDSCRAFYHPYDRVAAKSHPKWASQQPHLIWTGACSIVDYLNEFQSLLTCGDYLGV